MKVAVLYGGSGSEAKHSLAYAKQAEEALALAEHQVELVELNTDAASTLQSLKPNRCLIALPGKLGRSGRVQSWLDFLDIPYVGSTAEVCRLLSHKAELAPTIQRYRKQIGESGSVWWPRGFCLSTETLQDFGGMDAVSQLAEDRIPGGFPLAVKPAHGAYGAGVSKVESAEDLPAAIEEALAIDSEVLIEQWIEGVELSVAVLGNGWSAQAFAPVEILRETQVSSFSHEDVSFQAPVRLEVLAGDETLAQSVRSEIERAALEAYLASGAQGFGRVDVIWDGSQTRVIKVCTCPEITADSLFFASCQVAGLSIAGILDALIMN